MPTKSNNIGGRGGKRVGAGRKKKQKAPLSIENMELPDLEGVKMPKPSEYLSDPQKTGENLQAKEIYEESYKWLKSVKCEKLVSKVLLEKYAMCSARWIQCEKLTNQMGLLSKHPTTGKPIPSPFIGIGINYMNQSTRLWDEIFQIVRENGGAENIDSTPEDDVMERLLRARQM